MSDDLVRRIHDVRFTPVRLREGYAIGDVHAFLEQLAVDASTAGPSEPGARVVGPGGAGGPVHRPTQTDPSSSVISEQRGLFARLFRRS